MKRDMELIRRILLTIEAGKPVAELPGVTAEQLAGHIQLLDDAELVIARDVSDLDGPEFEIERITWKGHEFLDAARNQSVWNTVRRTLKEKAMTVTLGILQKMLIKELEGLAGV